MSTPPLLCRGAGSSLLRGWSALLLVLWVPPAQAAEPVLGKGVFRAQCALCHSAESADHGSSQGPDLRGLYGRHVAGDAAFSYSRALRGSDLTWDALTLERFLAAPTQMVKGTSMTYAVPSREDRDALVGYFQALKSGSLVAMPPLPDLQPPAGSSSASALSRSDGEWRRDVPGRVHRIDPQTLPAPRLTSLVTNVPKVVERPPDARAQLPPGFSLNVFASQLEDPHTLVLGPDGDIFLAETRAGRIRVLRPADDDSMAATQQSFAQGLYLPLGMAFYPNARHPKWLYVAESNRVVRYAYEAGDMRARRLPEVVVAQLAPSSDGHMTRDIAISTDGDQMLVTIGSQSNVAEGMPVKPPEDLTTWQAQHGSGAPWGDETGRGVVLSFKVEDRGPLTPVVTGLRDCVRITLQPRTGTQWCTVRERTGLGAELVPDFSTRLGAGQFYGWPWFYLGSHEDPRHRGERPELAAHVSVPDVLYQAQSGASDLVFYTGRGGRANFPREYVGDAFAVLHGSTRRASLTGHKLVRVRMKDNVPTGQYEDFLTGFIADDRSVWGSPTAAAEARDGALLVSDDGANLIYRISYSKR